MDSQHITEEKSEQVVDQLIDTPSVEGPAIAEPPAAEASAASTSGRRHRARRWAIAGLALLALIGAGATLASTTVQVTAENVMTFGDVKIKAIILAPAAEDASGDAGEGDTTGDDAATGDDTTTVPGAADAASAAGEDWADVTNEPLDAPFGKAERRVSFKNTGSHPIFVRARVGVNAVRAAAEPAGETEIEPWTAATFTLQLAEGTMPAAGAEEATGGWYAGTGEQAGWYYYGRILKPGETTEPLVTAVDLGDFNAKAMQGYHFELDVLGQGVQSENQEAPEGGVLNAFTAMGWPADEVDDAAEGTSAATTGSTTTTEGQE